MMDAPLISLASAVPATLAHLVLLGILLRVSRQRYVLPVFVCVFVLVFLATIWVGGVSVSPWHLFAFLGCGATLNLFLYGAVLKSLSLAMLAELAQRANGQATNEDLARCVIRPAFNERIGILVAKGYALPEGDHYATTRNGMQTAERMKALRARLGIDGLGLYQIKRLNE